MAMLLKRTMLYLINEIGNGTIRSQIQKKKNVQELPENTGLAHGIGLVPGLGIEASEVEVVNDLVRESLRESAEIEADHGEINLLRGGMIEGK